MDAKFLFEEARDYDVQKAKKRNFVRLCSLIRKGAPDSEIREQFKKLSDYERGIISRKAFLRSRERQHIVAKLKELGLI